MKIAANNLALVLLSLSLAGCSTAGGGSGANVSAVPATGTVVAQSDMPAFCQNAAASKYNAPPDNITTRRALSVRSKKRGVISAGYDSIGLLRFDGDHDGLDRNHSPAL
ncbi:hypothetical protein [Mesorhizobium sp. GR13]|uniref:hypothetical protein n=1 Tax=Mesorhizobium sp. GR13 TaxID=2562308 RepID=UPI0010BFA410|nr:hypothetical protein [Mesorhizobium sp. GR13]